MFKNLKEAKAFTAHLDALANEIEGLEGLSEDMKKHLAYRIDKLSDYVETSMDKTANGVGTGGSWMFDADEAKYMSTMGGTGALEKEKDEPYMDEFLGDDNAEVLKRKEPKEIKGGKPKVKQPSDDYNEKEVINKIKALVKKSLSK